MFPRPANGDDRSGALWRAYCEDSSLRAATMGTGWRTYMPLSGAYVTKTLEAARNPDVSSTSSPDARDGSGSPCPGPVARSIRSHRATAILYLEPLLLRLEVLDHCVRRQILAGHLAQHPTSVARAPWRMIDARNLPASLKSA